ncbi:hypothetical protein MPSEU_001010600 [Mayamaea pseudoterrestris]|nr:hypothetical protein MPSEU_001010600 [Mayamaea pseudoterrestris]
MSSSLLISLQRLPAAAMRSAARFKSTAETAETVSTKLTAVEAASPSSSSVPVGKALLAAMLGVSTVSIGAMAVEVSTADAVPKYDPHQQRYSQSEFKGRFARMLLACDPRLLIYTESQVRQAKDMIDNYQNYPNMDRELWEARRMVDAALHPDTGEVLPRPFRLSGYVPYNGPICVAMVASQSTMPLLFWSWVNQSQNALVNYYNRNASSQMSNETLAKSYAVAVGSALLVAFGLATAIQKKYEPSKAKQLLRFVAFPSAVVASSLNCYIVRSPEIDSGIPLTDEYGQDVLPGSTSKEAAARGVYSTTASRAILQAPVFFLPPVMVSLGPIKKYLMKNPVMAVPVSTYMTLVCFGLGLPATVAIFPQIAEIKAKDVEHEYQHLRNAKTDQPYEVFYYNKGL